MLLASILEQKKYCHTKSWKKCSVKFKVSTIPSISLWKFYQYFCGNFLNSTWYMSRIFGYATCWISIVNRMTNVNLCFFLPNRIKEPVGPNTEHFANTLVILPHCPSLTNWTNLTTESYFKGSRRFTARRGAQKQSFV